MYIALSTHTTAKDNMWRGNLQPAGGLSRCSPLPSYVLFSKFIMFMKFMNCMNFSKFSRAYCQESYVLSSDLLCCTHFSCFCVKTGKVAVCNYICICCLRVPQITFLCVHTFRS